MSVGGQREEVRAGLLECCHLGPAARRQAGVPHPGRRGLGLHAHLDEAQLEAVITGDAFSIGKLLVRSCVYTSGRIVHLQLHSRCAGAPTFQPKRYDDGSGFAQEPVCGQGGTYLEKFDDEYYEQLATTDKIRRCVFLTGRTLSGPEMLTSVCRDCACRAKLLSNRN